MFNRMLSMAATLLFMTGVTAQTLDDSLSVMAERIIRQRDSLQQENDSDEQKVQPIEHILHIEHRGYNDRISLRWAPEGYPALRVGLQYGYALMRVDETTHHIDTLASELLPLEQDAYISRFGTDDSLAMAAGELVFGTQPSFDGSLSFNEIMEEQNGIFAFMMIILDQRPDVAEALGLGYSDRKALSGRKYSYAVVPLKNDSSFVFTGVSTPSCQRGTYSTQPFPYAPTDSIMPPSGIQLRWPKQWYSAYDIERRFGSGDWEVLNKRPYITARDIYDKEGELINVFHDHNLEIGHYEYRIAGYDLFGERSEPGPALKVEIKDMIPPTAPLIKQFVVLHGDTLLDIHFRKDSLEDDLRGFRPYYYCPELFGKQWIKMSEEMALPTDTVMRVNIKGYLPGTITLAAVDQAGNEGYSLPMPFHMPDNIPPQTPKNLRAAVSPTGIVVLFWSPSPDKDIRYYSLYFANDSTHEFIQKPRPMTRDTIAFDTLDLSAMQQYRYYKVQAIDFAGNESPRSPWLQVVRPNFKMPQSCRLDSIWSNDSGLYSRWEPSPEPDIKEYVVLRRLRGEEYWEQIMELTPDSVRSDGFLYVHDVPPVNMERRYQYCIVSTNTTGVNSEPSIYAQYRWQGPRVLDIQIKLGVSYREEDKYVALAWEVSGLLDEYREGGYFLIQRRWEGEEDFHELATVRLSDVKYINYRFPRGKHAYYRMRYMNSDMRLSPFSNVASTIIPEE